MDSPSTTIQEVPHAPVPTGVLHPAGETKESFAILSTYPPTHCGLATFAAALRSGLEDVGVADTGVVRISDDPGADPEHVVARLRSGSPMSRVNAAREINRFDHLLLQHEFGIFAGPDGREVLDVLDDVLASVTVTLHTVPLVPTTGQRRVLEEIAVRADALVTMTRAARDRFVSVYDVDPRKVATIPHGAAVPDSFRPVPLGRIELLTWGLIGPGKGLEWVIDALAMIPELRDRVHYTIAGQTHPKVRASHGEEYRDMLRDRARKLGIESMVTFDDTYRSVDSLVDMVQDASCVVLPYDSDDQITSGVLVDAIGVGRPVIATSFPHAVELLDGGAGMVVPHREPVSLAQAIRTIANDAGILESMSASSRVLARAHRWKSVAAGYVDLAARTDSRMKAVS